MVATGQAEEQALEAQAERQEDDPWMAAVSEYVAGKTEVSCKEILERQLQVATSQMSRKDSMRGAGLLQRLGFVREGKFTSGTQKDLARYVRCPTWTGPQSEGNRSGRADRADEFQ